MSDKMIVEGVKVERVTNHAIDRYRSRACPDARKEKAREQIVNMANNARWAGKAQGGASRYQWGDVIMIIAEGVVITLYWKGVRVRDREKVSLRKLKGKWK